MKVLFLEKVPGRGNIDDIKEVADGYALHFLFPRHLAVQVSDYVLQNRETERRKKTKSTEADLHDEEQNAARLDGLELELTAKMSDKGILFAAVGPERLVNELHERGFKVTKNQVVMKPMKEAGSQEVKIKFRHGLEVAITVQVVQQDKEGG